MMGDTVAEMAARQQVRGFKYAALLGFTAAGAV